MNDFFLIGCGTGLRDGLNPCAFMTGAVFMAMGLRLGTSVLRLIGLGIFFGLAYIISSVLFDFGPAQKFILQRNFVFAAKIIYFVLGLWSFVLGVLFFKNWYSLHKGIAGQDPAGKEINVFKVNPAMAGGMIILSAVFLSALASLWPIDKYVIVLGNEALLRGQWQLVAPMLAGYAIASAWPLWSVWVFLSMKNLRPTLVKILCSAIFFTASSCLIFIFK
jgi:hypothetical protein